MKKIKVKKSNAGNIKNLPFSFKNTSANIKIKNNVTMVMAVEATLKYPENK